MLAEERTIGATKRLVSLRQKENTYSKCWALKIFVTRHPLLWIVINPAFCQTALLSAAQCQKKTSHAKYLPAGLAVWCCPFALTNSSVYWFHLFSQDQPLISDQSLRLLLACDAGQQVLQEFHVCHLWITLILKLKRKVQLVQQPVL